MLHCPSLPCIDDSTFQRRTLCTAPIRPKSSGTRVCPLSTLGLCSRNPVSTALEAGYDRSTDWIWMKRDSRGKDGFPRENPDLFSSWSVGASS